MEAANPWLTVPDNVALGPDGDVLPSATDGFEVPVCSVCGGMLKPDIVFFGEFIPVSKFREAEQLVSASDALIVAGSSLVVNSGVRLVERARRRKLPVVIINRGPTRADKKATVKIDGAHRRSCGPSRTHSREQHDAGHPRSTRSNRLEQRASPAGRVRHPLNDTGREQARDAAERLSTLLQDSVPEVVSSDLSRAAETADIIAARVGAAPVRRSTALRSAHSASPRAFSWRTTLSAGVVARCRPTGRGTDVSVDRASDPGRVRRGCRGSW